MRGNADVITQLNLALKEELSAIGGPKTATALLAEHLVSDIYLTTSAIDAGEPDTPCSEQPPADVQLVVRKAGRAG